MLRYRMYECFSVQELCMSINTKCIGSGVVLELKANYTKILIRLKSIQVEHRYFKRSTHNEHKNKKLFLVPGEWKRLLNNETE